MAKVKSKEAVERVGILGIQMMNVLKEISTDKDMKGIFNGKALENVNVVADNTDKEMGVQLRIEDVGMMPLDDEQRKRYLTALDKIITKVSKQ